MKAPHPAHLCTFCHAQPTRTAHEDHGTTQPVKIPVCSKHFQEHYPEQAEASAIDAAKE